MLWLGIHLSGFPAGLAWSEQSEREALARLAGWAGRFTPVVSLAPPRGLLLEVEGSLRLFGGPARLVARVEAGLRELGHAFGTALAPTPLAATLLARAAPGTRLTDASGLEEELARVPATALDLTPETAAALRGIGAATLGDCLRLPRAGLSRRIGPDLLRALDRALGRIPDPRTPFVPPPRYEGALALPAPVASAEPLLFAARRLLLELEGYLEARGGGAAALCWTLRHHGESATRVELGLAAPARDAGRLLRLLRERLERARLAAPVEGLELAVERILPLAPASLDLWTAREEQAELAWPELLDRLRARLGAAAVQGLRLAADHRPERAFERTDGGGGEEPAAPLALGPRPLWLLQAPAPLVPPRDLRMTHAENSQRAQRDPCAQARERGGQQRSCALGGQSPPGSARERPPGSRALPGAAEGEVSGARFERDGGPQRQDPGALMLVAGPERIESGWWDGGDVQRDYFVAEDRSGLRLWVFRERTGDRRWFLHGIFA